MLTAREWDIAQLESEMKVQGWLQEWVEALMEGRNPNDKLQQMSPQEAVDLRDGPPPQILQEPEAPQEGALSQLIPPPEEVTY